MPTLSLIISNDFLALTMAQWCFLLLSHRLKPTQKAIPPLLPLDISMHPATPPPPKPPIGIITHKEPVYFYILF